MTVTETSHDAVDMAADAADDAIDTASDLGERTRSTAGQVRDAVGGAMDRMPDVMETARTGVEQVAEKLPVVAERTRVGAIKTTASLQTLPDTTLKLLAGASVGLATGLSLAGAPRLVALAALVPALFVGGAVATRGTADRTAD